MLDYIWLNDETPILNQVPKEFKSVAILTNPFIQMPKGWAEEKRTNPNEHIYPDHDEILDLAKPVMWKNILENTDLVSLKEIALALKTSISALNENYARPDLADKLNLNFPEDLYYPNEDKISEFLIVDLIQFLRSEGAKRIYYSDPIFDNSGCLQLSEVTPSDLCNIYSKEVIITDEKMNYAFMSVYDSFITLFLTRNENPMNIVQRVGWEALRCDNNTYINWYLNR